MFGVPEIVLIVALISIPVLSLWNWSRAWQLYEARKPLLESSYDKNVSFGLLDLGIVVVVLGVIMGVVVGRVVAAWGIEDASAMGDLSPDDQSVVFLVFGAASVVGTAISLAWLWLRYQKVDGFNKQRWLTDSRLAFQWFTMLIVPVLLMQLLLTRWVPTQHPLIEMLRESENVMLLPVAAFAAVIAAPISEEILFRLFMQGWLEKLQTTYLRSKAGLADPDEHQALMVGGVSSATLPTPSSDANAPVMAERPVLWFPIIVSSSLFSLGHVNHGPDWIPLFFLALGLGYLFQRTRRIQACIIVHVLVNGLGIFQLWAAVRQS